MFCISLSTKFILFFFPVVCREKICKEVSFTVCFLKWVYQINLFFFFLRGVEKFRKLIICFEHHYQHNFFFAWCGKNFVSLLYPFHFRLYRMEGGTPSNRKSKSKSKSIREFDFLFNSRKKFMVVKKDMFEHHNQ
jgi:hypothetical protein